METTVILGDLQIPFQDQKVVDLVLDFLLALNPERVILNGDIVDFYSLSTFDKDPLSEASLQKEIAEAEYFLERLPSTSIVDWLGGNHEDRLRRYVWKHAPALGQLKNLSFEELFDLSRYEVNYYGYGDFLKVGKLYVTHGNSVRKDSGQTAKVHFEEYGKSIMVNHTHRMGAYYKTRLGTPYVAYENGCLCNLNPEYVKNPNWQQGFSIVHHDSESGFFNVQQCPIFRKKNSPVFFYGDEEIG